MRILALDIGNKNIGIAISDTKKTLITPLPKIMMKKFNGNFFFSELQINLKTYWDEISTLVIGNSEDLEYENNKSVVSLQNQIKRIFLSRTNWVVESIAEDFSSRESFLVLKKMNFSAKRIKKNIDSYAAAIILSNYFLKHNHDLLFAY